MIFQIRYHGQLAPIQGRVADAIDSLIGFNLQRDEIAAGAGRDHPGIGNLHSRDLLLVGLTSGVGQSLLDWSDTIWQGT